MNIKNVLLCSITNYRKWVVDIKIYTLFALIFVFNIWNFSGIYEYAKIVGVGVSPWIFPHIFITPVIMPVYGCFAMFLFSDAPFIDKHTPFLLIRTGRTPWVLGQLCYIVFTSLLYTIINYAITVISFFPYIDFTSDWGKVIRTLAMNPASAYEKGLNLTVLIDSSIVTSFSAIEATLISLGLFFLVTLFMGIVIFSFNIIIGKMSGIIAAGILIFISYFSIFVGRITIGLKVYYFSPLSWSSLRYIDWYNSGDSPSLQYAVIFLSVTSLILSIISVISFSKKDINMLEGM
ncbi:hypothetical protein [Mahella australiensis]|uniref:ABC-2 type transport system permease protein n=1 Tax=Mahella australiensis (strain DSM 15567 / CIP 107919 / 50-1 BON) TaxID=697281 RepID=F3ZXW2_MAHA5|nr:hypothetical protein [Mahella australiensis]AEE96632.1 hypothetical protein Mahau_1440 [Mahella australiensis 50-1 BON]